MKWLKGREASVVKKIVSAFPATPPPDEQHLVEAEIEHIRKCDECRHAHEFFTSKTREAILADERNYDHLVNAFDFFTPETWHYYLPVFLIQDLIRQRHSFNHFWHHNELGLIETYWSPRIELLNAAQCEALIEYLEYWKSYAIEADDLEEWSRVLQWWQSIYQEKFATLPNNA